MLISTGADKTQIAAVLRCAIAHDAHGFHFGFTGRYVLQGLGDDVLGDFVEQVIDAVGTDGVEHTFYVIVCVGNVGHVGYRESGR